MKEGEKRGKVERETNVYIPASARRDMGHVLFMCRGKKYIPEVY